MRMEKSIKCPGCGQEYQEQMAQCACGWDFTEDFVLYPSVGRIPEESEQFHIVEDAYIKKDSGDNGQGRSRISGEPE